MFRGFSCELGPLHEISDGSRQKEACKFWNGFVFGGYTHVTFVGAWGAACGVTNIVLLCCNTNKLHVSTTVFIITQGNMRATCFDL